MSSEFTCILFVMIAAVIPASAEPTTQPVTGEPRPILSPEVLRKAACERSHEAVLLLVCGRGGLAGVECVDEVFADMFKCLEHVDDFV